MAKVCVIVGSAFTKDHSFLKMGIEVVLTKYGKVRFYRDGNIYYLQRHGTNTPPHRINHKANMKAIEKIGVKDIIGVNSCGSLREDIPPGSIVVPDDYIDLHNTQTFFDDDMRFTVPEMSQSIRKKIIKAGKNSRIKLVDGGTYIQTRGPRFETKAEIRFFSAIADLVGMTMANEATLARELGLNYACISSIDNYANGIGRKKLTMDEVSLLQMKSGSQLKRLIRSAAKVIG